MDPPDSDDHNVFRREEKGDFENDDEDIVGGFYQMGHGDDRSD